MAKEYGQSPSQIREWPFRDFQEALIILEATNRQKWPLEPEPTITPATPQQVMLLDHDQRFWMWMVVDGRLDLERMTMNGYTPEQIPWLEAEMRRLGWL